MQEINNSKKLNRIMKTFHGKQEVKDRYVNRVKAHEKADKIIKGKYWENGKGCAVGCTIESDDHSKYETELGVPEWLAKLEDSIFEGLPNDEAMKFPVEFLEAIPIGVDENELYKLRCDLDFQRLAILLDNLEPEESGVEKAIRDVMVLNLEQVAEQDDRWSAAKSAARSAARSATWSAARSAARSATWSATWSATESAAWSGEKTRLLKGLKEMKTSIKEKDLTYGKEGNVIGEIVGGKIIK